MLKLLFWPGTETPTLAFGGDRLPALLKAIASSQRKFSRPPIGPIGAHLSLEDDHWAVAVEASIGSIFDSFIVHNHPDMQLLKVLLGSNAAECCIS